LGSAARAVAGAAGFGFRNSGVSEFLAAGAGILDGVDEDDGPWGKPSHCETDDPAWAGVRVENLGFGAPTLAPAEAFTSFVTEGTASSISYLTERSKLMKRLSRAQL